MSRQLAIRPNITDLAFQAFDRAIHPELVDSVVSRRFDLDGHSLVIHLTPDGHWLMWSKGPVVVVETLLDQLHVLPETGQLFAHRVGQERAEQRRLAESINYQSCFVVERLPAEIFDCQQEELRRSSADGLFCELHANDRLGFSPISFVDPQTRVGSVLCHFYHTFPDECAIVKVQTLIEFDP